MRQTLDDRGGLRLRLDHIERRDPIERRLGDRRLRRFPHVEELASAMRPARYFGDWPRLGAGGIVERLKTGISVGLEKAGEPRQMSRRVLAAPIGAEEIDGRRRRCPPERPHTAALDP